MLGKLANGTLVTPSKDELKKIIIANPTEEHLKFVMGYKDIIVDDEPELAENQYLVAVFEETDEAIVQHWNIGEYIEEEIKEKINIEDVEN